MLILSTAYFGRIFSVNLLKRHLPSRYIPRLLLISAIGISSTPILWVISQNLMWIIFIELLSGFYWAGIELSFLNLFLTRIPESQRQNINSLVQVLNITGMGLGTALGTLYFYFIGTNFNDYLVLFGASVLVRLFVVIYFWKKNLFKIS
jgi:MFS family permease